MHVMAIMRKSIASSEEKFRSCALGFNELLSLFLQVQTGLRLPLTGLAPPRLLMCSASMGAEGSVTLQLREAVQAPVSESGGTTINNALTIGYPDPEMLADVLGTFQAAGSEATYDIVTNGRRQQQFFKTANGITTIKNEAGK